MTSILTELTLLPFFLIHLVTVQMLFHFQQIRWDLKMKALFQVEIKIIELIEATHGIQNGMSSLKYLKIYIQ